MTSGFEPHAFIKTLVTLPGVYRMVDASGTVLYVGKARNLRRRVASYFRENPSSAKVRSLVAQIQAIEVTVTHTETEALILESRLIKQFQPRYNILLRDDKGYPYIHLSADAFPRLSLHRGAKKTAGRYFGPYPHAHAVRDTLNLLQKLFQLRSCEDHFFRSRTRPCLQYQIQRCSAPCVGQVSPTDYARQISDTTLFLEGRASQVIEALAQRMEQAATALDFEGAARLRDQIAELRQIQHRQFVEGESGDWDAVAVATDGGIACVQVFVFRGGRLLGNKAFFPQLPQAEDAPAILSAFLAQHYLEREIPTGLLLSHPLAEADLLAEAFQQRTGRRVTLTSHPRGERARWLELAQRNAEHALAAQLASRLGMAQRLDALQHVLGLAHPPQRMECFDISHTQGEATVAACVVFDAHGPRKSDYRRYNIEHITPGDDFAALHQALTRRYSRLHAQASPWPDVLFIDGGKGQLAQASAVLQELQVNAVLAVGVAKGTERKPGLETLFLSGQTRPLILPADSAALHLVQQIRDEAHRFAITGHRQRRAKTRTQSALEQIPGIGPKRRQALLRQFGGLKQLAQAGVEDLRGINGVSAELAQRIYDAFHGQP